MNAAADSRMRAGAVLDDLRWLFHAVEDGPSDVVIITGGLPSQASMRPDIERTIRIARTTRVRVHVLEAADLSSVSLPEGGQPADASAAQTVEHSAIAFGLPAETGGIEGGGTVSGDRFFERLGRELAGSYLLSFEPLPHERDGQPHRIEIRTSRRPRPTIHARKVFVLEPGAGRAAEPAVAAGAPGGRDAGGSAPPAEATGAAGADGPRAAVEADHEAAAEMRFRGMAGMPP